MLPNNNNDSQNTKGEMHDLLLGETNEPASKSKKFFLIAAGVLLTFFIALGAMKIIGGNGEEDKQAVAIEKAKEQSNVTAQAPDMNATTDANASEDKLNEIVQKLQQEAAAQSQASQAPTTEVAPIALPAPTKQEVKQAQAPAPAPKVQETHSAPTVVQAPSPSPIKSTPVPIAQAKPKPKEEAHQNTTPKAAMNEAVKKQPQPAQKAPAATPKPVEKTAAPENGKYYIQVGACAANADVTSIQSKATSLGFKSIVKKVQTGDKTLQKIQVGPFNTKEAAQEALNKAKEVNSGAFVVKSTN